MDQNKDKDIQQNIEIFLDSNVVTIIMTTITIYALFGDDIRVLSTDKDGDPVFWGINIFAMIMFSLEVIIACLGRQDYFNGFFFWLDAISTLSLLLDIGWFTNILFGSGGGAGANSAATLARAGRASRVGTKAGRIVRIVRLIRLVKLYKQAQQALDKAAQNLDELEQELQGEQQGDKGPPLKKLESANKQQQQPKTQQTSSKNALQENENLQEEFRPKGMMGQKLPPIKGQQLSQPQPIDVDDPLMNPKHQKLNSLSNAKEIIEINKERDQTKQETIEQSQRDVNTKVDEKKAEENIPVFKETNVGKKLSDLTTRRVIILVMSIMFSIPIFTLNTYQEPVYSMDIGLGFTQVTPVIYIKFQDFDPVKIPCCSELPNRYFPLTGVDYRDLRQDEQQIYTFQNDYGDTVAYAIYDVRPDYNLNAILSIIRTIFVSIVLGGGAMLFSKDVEDYVVSPIEKMLEKVKRIAANPLNAAQIEENEAMVMEELEKKGDSEELKLKKEQEKYETAILEKLIIKTGALLALGFGEAGAEIIAENMAKGGEVDPMLPGRKMVGIFAFCAIRQFEDATEVLQTGIMLFANEISEIAHGTVDQFCGQTNKNLGDVFVLAWKYLEDDFVRHPNGSVQLKNEQRIKEQADLPVLACIKIVIGYTMSNKLVKYNNNPQLNAKYPNYSVNMGMGLHIGWAIEGAIGSNFKIDASYLSPNVNISARLMAATKQFGVNILLTGELYKQLTIPCQQQLRRIDKVTVKGSIMPVDFWTVDISVENMKAKCKRIDRFDTRHLSQQNRKKKRVVERLKRNKLKKEIDEGTRHIADLFKTDREIICLREIFPKEFTDKFNEGFQHYLDGNWDKAIEFFKTMVPTHRDGPSNTLIRVIEQNGGKPPTNPKWEGYRVLTEK